MTYYVYKDWDSYSRLVLGLPKDHEALSPTDTGYRQNPYDSPIRQEKKKENKKGKKKKR